MKQRISITVDAEVLKLLDNYRKDIPRSEIIEKILKEYLSTINAAVFLAGGSPEKLKIDNTFRHLVKIKDKLLIEYNLEKLRDSGFRNIYFIGQSEIIGETFKKIGNGKKYGVNITYIEEERELGNAKTLELAKDHLKSTFLVLPIDNYFTFDLENLLRVHRKNNAIITLAVHASRESVTNLGVVEMDGDRIIRYEEKPVKPKTYLTSMFIGVYEPVIFDFIPKGNVKCVLQTDVFPQVLERKGLYGCIVTGITTNVHSFEDVKKLEKLLE